MVYFFAIALLLAGATGGEITFLTKTCVVQDIPITIYSIRANDSRHRWFHLPGITQ